MPKVEFEDFDPMAFIMDAFHKSVKANIKTMLKGIFSPKAQRFLDSRLRVTVHNSDEGSLVMIRFFYDNYLELESSMNSSGQIDFKYKKLSVKDYVAAIESAGLDIEKVHEQIEGLKAIEDMFDLPIKIATPQVALQFTKKGLPFVVELINTAMRLA